MKELERGLKEEDIEWQISKKMHDRGILEYLKRIDDADVVYAVNLDNCIGKRVSVDVGYPYARSKSIYVMHSVDDPPVMDFLKEDYPT